jgi:hypothetical protein
MGRLLGWVLLSISLASFGLAADGDCKLESFTPVDHYADTPLVPRTRFYIRITVKKAPGSKASWIYVDPHGSPMEDGTTYDIEVGDPSDPMPLYSDISPGDVQNFLDDVCGSDFARSLKPTRIKPKTSASQSVRVAAMAVLSAASGQASQGFFVADLNGDGVPDAVTVAPSRVYVTIRHSDGTAPAISTYRVGPNSAAGIAADFNGDGIPDLAIANNGSAPTELEPLAKGSVSILLGNGDGTFQPAVVYPVTGEQDSLVTADFNGDGKLDLATVGFSSSPNVVSILLGNGDGTFGPISTYAVGSGPGSVVVSDFNHDGLADLAVLNFFSKDVSVLLGLGDGTFQPAVATCSGTGKGYLGFVDLNQDGIMDLLIADSDSNTLVPMLGNGDGTFMPPVRYLAGARPASLGIIPLRDGNTAIFTADDVSGDLILAFAAPDATLSTPSVAFVGQRLSAIAAADLNADGRQDLAIADLDGGNIYVKLTGTDAPPAPYPINSPIALALADLNGDAAPDLVAANTSGIAVLTGAGDGTFGPAQSFATGNLPTAFALGDFNGDGKLDVAVAGTIDYSTWIINVLPGGGDGSFQAPLAGGLAFALPLVAVVAGDFNGDGALDLAVSATSPSGNTSTLSILLGNGDGTFQAPVDVPLSTPTTTLLSMTTGDLDGDGRLDLVLLTADGASANYVSVLVSNGDGTFRQADSSSTGFGPVNAVVTDLDGDGKADVVVAHCCGDTDATYLLGNGDGTFQPEAHILSGSSPTAIAVGDFDGDGSPDLAIAGQIGTGKGGSLVVMLNRFRVPPTLPPAPQ